VTLEQVCRVLHEWCRTRLQNRRGLWPRKALVATLQYHQIRNATAARSQQKRPHRYIIGKQRAL
jgi:hypothetical protein